MRILHVLAPAPVGGLNRIVEALAGGQARRHDVHAAVIYGTADAEPPLLASLRAAGVSAVPLRIPDRAYVQERARIADLCRALRPGVLHTHGYRPDVVDAGVARRMGVPTATTVHGFTGGDSKNRFYEWLQVRAYRRFGAVVAVSRKLARDLEARGVPAGKIHAIPNAWGRTSAFLEREAARRRLDVAGDAFHVGWVGRISREKGLDVLIDALPSVAELPIRLSIIGDGPERGRLEPRASAAAPDGRVRWHGALDDAGRYFPAFDAFVISSRTEGTPVVLFEAMAAGVPVVATRVGGIPEVVTQDEAVLVASEDPDAIARALRSVYRDPASAAALAARARRKVCEEFAMDAWLDRYDTVYRGLEPERRVFA